MKKSTVLRYLHLSLTITWALLLIPTLIWWKNSVMWIAIMSVYANTMASFAAYQGARTEKKEEERDENGKDD